MAHSFGRAPNEDLSALERDYIRQKARAAFNNGDVHGVKQSKRSSKVKVYPLIEALKAPVIEYPDYDSSIVWSSGSITNVANVQNILSTIPDPSTINTLDTVNQITANENARNRFNQIYDELEKRSSPYYVEFDDLRKEQPRD